MGRTGLGKKQLSCDCLGAVKVREILKESILSLNNTAVLVSKSCQRICSENPSSTKVGMSVRHLMGRGPKSWTLQGEGDS